MAPKSDQKSKPPLKRKNQLNISGVMFSWLSGLQVGSKNLSKINQKRRSTWEGILASIFDRFWWILGGKLGSKIEQKSIQKGIKKAMENILDLEAIWERFGSQVGTENEAKMNTKRHAKNDAKMMGGWLRPGWGGVYPFPSLGNTRKPPLY